MAMPSTVLVVDDAMPSRRRLRAALERSGHRVVEAAHRDEAFAALRDHEVDLMVLDGGLDDAAGWSVLSAVRAHPDHADLPIVCLGASDGAEAARALFLGANDHM